MIATRSVKAALTLLALGTLAGCVSTAAPAPSPAPVVVQQPAMPAPAVVVTPRTTY